MMKMKKVSSLLLAGALFLAPTSASAANLYSVMNNKWEAGSSSIQNAVLTIDNEIFATGSSRYARLNITNGLTLEHGKNKAFTTKDMIRLSDGNIFVAGTLGKWKLLDSMGAESIEGKLVDPRTPRFVKQLSNGNILLVHDKGYYTTLDSTTLAPEGNEYVLRTGKWQNDWHINDSIELDDKNLLMVGDKGNYQLMTPADGQVVTAGDWGSAKDDIHSIDRLSDGRMIAVGEGSKFVLFDKSGKELDNAELLDSAKKSYTWDKVIALKNQHALFISTTGVMILVHVDNNNQISIKTTAKINNFSPNGSEFKIDDNKVFVTLTSGRFMVYQADL
jgi:hypothetical protein